MDSPRSMTEEEIRINFGIDDIQEVTFLKQGQLPYHNGVQLFEKEYIGQGPNDRTAIDGAFTNLRNDYRGEHVYTRGVMLSKTETGYLAVLCAALRVAPKNFSQILNDLKKGQNVRRVGWNGAGQYVYLQDFSNFSNPVGLLPCFVICNAQGKLQPGWLPSIGDLMADDWEIA